MDLIHSDESTGPDGAGSTSHDPLRQIVHVTLAIYLMPVVAIVCAIGGASILLGGLAQIVGRFATHNPPNANPNYFRNLGAVRKPSTLTHRRRIRV